MLKNIDTMLQDWVEFQARLLDSGGPGYPSQSPLATLIDYRTRRRLHPAKPQIAVAAPDIHPVEKQHVNVDVESENRYCNLIT